MKTYFKGFQIEEGIRNQPWTTAVHDESQKYYDFRSHPELIPEVLEDYKPWDHYESVRGFYELVRWVNGEDSGFESNDAVYQGPNENGQKEKFPKELVCSGRLMFFFRTLGFNLSADSRQFATRDQRALPDYRANLLFEWFVRRSMELIVGLHQETEWACIAPEIYPAYYSEAPVDEADQFGHQLSFQFWAWGDDEQETMENFGAVVDTILQSLRILSAEIPEAIREIRSRLSSSNSAGRVGKEPPAKGKPEEVHR